MKVFVKDIPQEGLSFNFSADKEEWLQKAVKESFGDLFHSNDFVSGSILCTRNRDNVHMIGHFKASFHPLCSRCSNPFPLHLDIPIEMFFTPTYSCAEEGEEEIELVQEDLDFSFYDGEMLDVGEQIREQIILAIPQQPVCREDCKGLCPQCGIDRNKESCRCSEKPTDARLNALKTLKRLPK